MCVGTDGRRGAATRPPPDGADYLFGAIKPDVAGSALLGGVNSCLVKDGQGKRIGFIGSRWRGLSRDMKQSNLGNGGESKSEGKGRTEGKGRHERVPGEGLTTKMGQQRAGKRLAGEAVHCSYSD